MAKTQPSTVNAAPRLPSPPHRRAISATGITDSAPKAKADGNRKLSYKESRELAELPGKIAALEQEQKEINLRLEDPALYQSQPRDAAFRRPHPPETQPLPG